MPRGLKKSISIMIILQIILSSLMFTTIVNAAGNVSRMLKVSGNQIVLEENPEVVVRLTGLNIPGGEWTGTPDAERIKRSTTEALQKWDSNLIRLPVGINGWFGNYSYVNDGGTGYRKYMDEVIQMISDAGKYVVLDLHHYKQFDNQKYLDFWVAAANKYKNNPAVLFGILNEPHGTTWNLWRNGNGSNIKGHQYVVEMIRDLGAKNIIVAGGLDWAYDLRGIVGEATGDPTVYALIDQGSNNNLSKAGNGIVYDTHIYPWKGRTANWHNAIGTARMLYPILVGENGWQPTDVSDSSKTYDPGTPMYHDQWVPELFAWMNDVETYGNLAHWTGWCFHPTSSPVILVNDGKWKDADYAYPPTNHWGVYVKNQLKADLGTNLSTGRPFTASPSDPSYSPANALDDNPSTMWASGETGPKHLTVDLGSEKQIDRWIVRHAGSGAFSATYNTKDFKLQVSNDQENWTDVDSIVNNTSNITDRYIPSVTARYARLYVTQAASSGDFIRIYQFAVYGGGVDSPEPPETVMVNFIADGVTIATREVAYGGTLTDIPEVPYKQGHLGTWNTSSFTNLLSNKTVTAIYQSMFIPNKPILVDKMLERNMKQGQQPGLWGSWNGTTHSYQAGTAENAVDPALHITGGASGGGCQIAFTQSEFNDFTGFDAFYLRVKSTASFNVKMRLEYRAQSPTLIKDSRAVTIPSTNGQWADVYITAQDLMPAEDGDWINSMKYEYTTSYQPVVLMRFENINFGSSHSATIGNIKALWYIPNDAPPELHSNFLSFTNAQGNKITTLAEQTEIQANVLVQNRLAVSKSLVMLMAIYQNNKLIGIKATAPQKAGGVVDPGEILNVTSLINLQNYEGADSIRVFVWDGLENMNQLLESFGSI